MADRSALWADFERDLDDALRAASEAAALTADLPLAPNPRLRAGAEAGVGKALHDAYSAVEAALERALRVFDEALPVGPRWHAQLLDRAAGPVEGRRSPILSAQTRDQLKALLDFRHVFRSVYGGFDLRRAEHLVPLAASATGAAAREIEAFCRAGGLRGPDAPSRFGG